MSIKNFAVFVFLIIVVALSSYFTFVEWSGKGRVNDKDLQSTDLSSVTVAGLRLGLNIDDIDMAVFRETEKGYILHGFVNDEEYNDEVYIDVEPDGTITKIQGRLHIGLWYEINGTDNLQSLQDIKDELGDNYNDYLYSRELGYNAITYTDKENDISLTFFYSMFDGKLIWAVLTLSN